MFEDEQKFHEFALKSILFKGRTDWYFCYLKSEKIAHVLWVLAERSEVKERDAAYKLASAASELPHTIAHFAAGEVDAQVVVADIFSLLSRVRFALTSNFIGKDNGLILLDEYRALAERFSLSVHPSPFLPTGDFAVPELDGIMRADRLSAPRSSAQSAASQGQQDKGHSKGHMKDNEKGQSQRLQKILEFVRENKSSSIKDIAKAVRGCSEKTIQRELAILIRQGLVKKVGERRWSLYIPLG